MTTFIPSRDRSRQIRTVLWVVLALNLAVALAKLFYGIISHSAAMEATPSFRGVLHTLGDAARLPADEVADVAAAVPGVVAAHGARTRGPASQVAVDLHVQVDPETTVARGHAITHEVEDALRKEYGQITDVVVHLEPAGSGQAAARQVDPRRVD